VLLFVPQLFVAYFVLFQNASKQEVKIYVKEGGRNTAITTPTKHPNASRCRLAAERPKSLYSPITKHPNAWKYKTPPSGRGIFMPTQVQS
jgi:hypothetical protein